MCKIGLESYMCILNRSIFLDKEILRKYPSLYIKEIYPALITNFKR